MSKTRRYSIWNERKIESRELPRIPQLKRKFESERYATLENHYKFHLRKVLTEKIDITETEQNIINSIESDLRAQGIIKDSPKVEQNKKEIGEFLKEKYRKKQKCMSERIKVFINKLKGGNV